MPVADVFESRLVSQALGLPPETGGPAGFSLITTDSRHAGPGALFVAIKGERVDGHDFIPQAIAQGANGILCRASTAVPKGLNQKLAIYKVEDTVQAYRAVAGAWRKRFSIPIIAVAGSVGKTTTKEFLAVLLRGKWSEVLQTQASENGFIGVAKTLLELRSKHRAAVVEIGIDEPGAMTRHLKLVAPTASLLTAIGPEHLEKLQNLETVVQEELLALEYVEASGGETAVNLDEPEIASRFKPNAKSVGFSIGSRALPSSVVQNYKQVLIARVSSEKMDITSTAAHSEFQVPLPLPGDHNARNLLGAIAIATTQGVTQSEMTGALKNFKGAEGRSDLVKLEDSTQVLCDYYNANPTSMEAAFRVMSKLSETSPDSARIFCLADMAELGEDELQFHRSLSEPLKAVLKRTSDRLFLFGSRMKALQEVLKVSGFPGTVSHFDSREDLANAVQKIRKRGDLILIKGSRSMKMEEVWELLQAHQPA